MKGTTGLVLLLLLGICFLSVFSCTAAADYAVAEVQRANASYTYRYAIKYITNIQISVPVAEVTFYTQPQQEEIVIQVTGDAIEGVESGKTLVLNSDARKAYKIDIYLPERFYHVMLDSESLQLRTINTVRGSMTIRTDYLEAELDGYCGGISFVAKEGFVAIKDGNLQTTSTVSFTEEGNIYLHTKITDYAGVSSFYTKNGAVKIQMDQLETDTLFEVSAIAVEGEYPMLPADEKIAQTSHKVQLTAENGIVYFVN